MNKNLKRNRCRRNSARCAFRGPVGGAGDGGSRCRFSCNDGPVSPTGSRRDERAKNARVSIAQFELGVPLDAEAKTPPRILDALDDAVLGNGINDDTGADLLDRLMMGAVDVESIGAR